LQVDHLGDLPRADAVEHIGVAATGAGRGAGRVDQDRIEAVFWFPHQRIGAHGGGFQPGAFEVVFEQFKPPFAHVERGDVPPGRRQLHGLAARRGAQIKRIPPRTLTQQPRRDRGGEILHPPIARLEIGKAFDRRAARQADMARCQRHPAHRNAAGFGFGSVFQRQIEFGREGETGGDGGGAFRTPTGDDRFGQGGRIGQHAHTRLHPPGLHHRGEHAMRQAARTACQQRQAGGDHRVRRGVQSQRLRQHDPQHHPRLGVIGQALFGDAVDQRINVSQPAQRLARNRTGERAVGRGANRAERRALGDFQRLPPAQNRIKQTKRSAAHGKSGGGWHGRPLTTIETKRQHAHLGDMTKQKSDAAKQFTKPAHWTNDPVPAPKQVDPLKGEPKELSPTRYGDWEKNGIAWDF